MQLNHIQVTLARRDCSQDVLNDAFFGAHEVRALSRESDKGSPILSGLFQKGGSAAALSTRIDAADIEETARRFQHAIVVKIRQTVNDAVSRQNDQASPFHADEGHHHEFVRGILIDGASLGAAVIAIVESSLVAVMAVCNQQSLVTHELLN